MSYFKSYDRKSAPVQYEYTAGINSAAGLVLINSNINCSGYNKIGVFFEGVSGGDGKGGILKIVSKPSSSISIDIVEPNYIGSCEYKNAYGNSYQNLQAVTNKLSLILLNGMDYIDVMFLAYSTTDLTSIKYWIVFYND